MHDDLAGVQRIQVTGQALLICSARNVRTIRHVLSIIAFCVKIFRPARKFWSCKLSYYILGHFLFWI
jgi:hypothetical protein